LVKTETTLAKIKNALKSLPTGSDAYGYAYKDAMERIAQQDKGFRELARSVLPWIICARRPLLTAELQHAIAVEVGDKELNTENLPQVEDMVSVCAGLVTVDEKSGIIRLVHYTTQEYFEQTWSTWFPNAQVDIAKTCVTYLSFDTFNIGFSLTDKDFKARLKSNILYDYAARNWGHHARTSSFSTEGETLMLDLLESKGKVSACSQAMMVSGSYLGYSHICPRQITGMHLAAYFGLVELITALLERQHDLTPKDENGQTPLHWAAENGYGAVVKLLLEQDVEPGPKIVAAGHRCTRLPGTGMRQW
jgi:Ankyrin repeats (3 copies)